MSEMVKAAFYCRVMPNGEYQVISEDHGGPMSWISEILIRGGKVHRVEVDLPLPDRPVFHAIAKLVSKSA